jgi:hypothetical protein
MNFSVLVYDVNKIFYEHFRAMNTLHFVHNYHIKIPKHVLTS